MYNIVRIMMLNWVVGLSVAIGLTVGMITYMIIRMKGNLEKVVKCLNEITKDDALSMKDIILLVFLLFIWEIRIPINAPKVFTQMHVALRNQEKDS